MQDKRYKEANKEMKQRQQEGKLQDAYTGKKITDEITWVLPEKLGQCRLYTLPVTHLPALLQLGFQA